MKIRSMEVKRRDMCIKGCIDARIYGIKLSVGLILFYY
jgi:hypothetical protein